MPARAAARSMLVISVLLCGCRSGPSTPPVDTVPVIEGSPAAPTAPAEVAGPDLVHLAGAIEVPVGPKLEYFAVLERGTEGGYTGKLDIPLQGARGVALEDIEVDEEHIAFTLAPVKAHWRASVGAEGALACSFEQMGVTLPCKMEKVTPEALAAATRPSARPQTPKAPFPYDAIEVQYDNAAAGVHLAGTLTVPPGDGPHPVALMISGSGAQDRDESIMGHKPFAVIADHLARKGIAVLRVDDRGVGGSSGGEGDPTSDDFAGDVLAGVEFLAKQPRIDPKRIGLIGHSEGGIVAPLVASRSKKVAFVVLLAGPGVPGSDLLVKQVGALAEASGATKADVQKAEADQRKIVDIIVNTKDVEQTKAKLAEVLAELAPAGEQHKAQMDAQIAMLVSPWFRFFMKHDPRPVLRKVKCPVLVVNGELDRQVVAQQNVPAIESALAKGKNRRVAVHRMAGLNHLLQPATTGGVDEYERIETTIAPEVLELLAEWINTTVPGKTKPAAKS